MAAHKRRNRRSQMLLSKSRTLIHALRTRLRQRNVRKPPASYACVAEWKSQPTTPSLTLGCRCDRLWWHFGVWVGAGDTHAHPWQDGSRTLFGIVAGTRTSARVRCCAPCCSPLSIPSQRMAPICVNMVSSTMHGVLRGPPAMQSTIWQGIVKL
jgi:hypothetical protein